MKVSIRQTVINCSISILLVMVALFSHAQNKPVEKNGTVAMPDIATGDDSIPVSRKIFTRSPTATYLVKSSLIKVGVYIDPAKWGVTRGSISEVSEFNFIDRTKDINILMVNETTAVSFEYLPSVILNNLQSTDPDAYIMRKEYRKVNGVKVLFIQGSANIMKLPFYSYTYVFTDAAGTSQLTAMIAAAMHDKYAGIIESFLNGFVSLHK